MPRRRSPPRLYLDRKRQQWVIRDGSSFVRTGCAESDRREAEAKLAEYLGQKHKPESGLDPLIADVLNIYAAEHLPFTSAARNSLYNISNLAEWFGGVRLGDLAPRACREYAQRRTSSAARRDLEVLRAAIRFYSRERGPIAVVPSIVLPRKSHSRDRWLTRSEAARLLWAARRLEHLRRFVLIGLYTGTRSGAIFKLKWDQIDVDRGIMLRRGKQEHDLQNKRRPPVRVGAKLLSFLRRWRDADRGKGIALVVHYDGAQVQKLRRSWRGATKRAGLGQDVTPHTLRHTRATWLMQRGIDPWEAAGHLGMSIETLTRTYGHHHPDWQEKAANV
jgi:integrase